MRHEGECRAPRATWCAENALTSPSVAPRLGCRKRSDGLRCPNPVPDRLSCAPDGDTPAAEA